MLKHLLDQGSVARGGPFIHQLTGTLEHIRRQEMERLLHKKMSGKEVDLLNEATKGLMVRVLGLVAAKLHAARQRGEADQLMEVLAAVYDLENTSAHVGRD